MRASRRGRLSRVRGPVIFPRIDAGFSGLEPLDRVALCRVSARPRMGRFPVVSGWAQQRAHNPYDTAGGQGRTLRHVRSAGRPRGRGVAARATPRLVLAGAFRAPGWGHR